MNHNMHTLLKEIIAYTCIFENSKLRKVQIENVAFLKLCGTFMKVLCKYDRNPPSCFHVENIGRYALKPKKKNCCNSNNLILFYETTDNKNFL